MEVKDLEKLISVDEAARQLGGISKWTIYYWLSRGRMRRTKVGSRTMLRVSELEKVIEDGGKSPVPIRKAAQQDDTACKGEPVEKMSRLKVSPDTEL
jgi:excisionase family DNA binding protein